MSKTKISEFSTTPGNNTDINGINIAEGCAPSGINNAIRELMSDLKEWQSGAMDVYVIPQGTAAAPGIQLYGDLDTGLYGFAANQLGVAVGGASAGYFSSAGWVGNVNGTITGDINATTIDTTNLEVTNIKAKDGTAAITIADSTGVVSVSTQLAVDNLNLSGNTLSSSDTNGNIILAPNGTGDVYLDADTIRVGDSNANAIITTNGTGDLTLNTNSGTNSGAITIEDGANGNINIVPNGTGGVYLDNTAGTSLFVRNTTSSASGSSFAAFQNKDGAGNYRTVARASGLTTSNGGNGSFVVETAFSNVLYKGLLINSESDVFFYDSNGNQALKWDSSDKYLGINQTSPTAALDVVGDVKVSGTVNAATIDLTNIEVSNIKAKDGTAAITIADSTGAVGISTAVTMSATTQNIALGTSQTTGTFTVGGTAQTGTQTFDQSTKTHTLNLGTGATESGLTKTINLGTGGVSTSTTAINIGSANGTTISLAANPTLSAGTANGVVYLNASKSATSGSALTFDGTNLGLTLSQDAATKATLTNANAGTSASARYEANNGSNTTEFGIRGTAQSTNGVLVPQVGYMYSPSAAGLALVGAAGPIMFAASGTTEGMRLTSTGLGIGETNPTQKLDVVGNIRVTSASASTTFSNGANFTTGATTDSAVLYSGNLLFGTSPTERMRLDSSGNLGLGVTPSAWASGNRFMDVNASASYGAFGSSDTMMLVNAYWNGSNWIRKNRNNAFRIVMESLYTSPTMTFQVAADGVQGSTISFTQAMTLDASGRLLVGPTSAASVGNANFAVTGGSVYDGNFSLIAQLTNDTTAAGKGVLLGFNNSTNTGIISAAYGNGSESLAFWTHNNTSWGERARITSDGNLYVGVISPATAGRIVADGGDAFYAGTFAQPSSASNCIAVHNRGTSGDNAFVIFGTEAAFTTRGSIDYNRAGGQVRYNTTSDYRAKEVYGPVTDSGAQIDALKVYQGKMIGATQERPMMIAHEAQEVVPYAVGGEKDAVNDDGTPKYQTMDHQILVPLLIAELQSLRARVAQLEGK